MRRSLRFISARVSIDIRLQLSTARDAVTNSFTLGLCQNYVELSGRMVTP